MKYMADVLIKVEMNSLNPVSNCAVRTSMFGKKRNGLPKKREYVGIKRI